MYWQSINVLEFVISVGLPTIVSTLLGAGALWGGEQFVRRFWQFWRALRRHIDQANDPAIIAAAIVLHKLTGEDIDRKALVEAIKRYYDEVLQAEGVPIPERETDASA